MNLTLITHMAVGLAAAVGMWVFQDARMDAAVTNVRSEMSDAKAKAAVEQTRAVKEARAEEQALTKTYQEALNAARTRETALRRNLDSARAESDGLRNQAADAARLLAAAPPAAVLEYATTVNGLFADCGRSYQELAGKADGHASDVRTLIEAWPVIKK